MRPVARIAQSVEQGIENPRVLGSIPSPGTKFISTDLYGGPFFVSERLVLSVLPPNQFYRTQPDPPHINSIVRAYPSSTEFVPSLNAFSRPNYGTDRQQNVVFRVVVP